MVIYWMNFKGGKMDGMRYVESPCIGMLVYYA